MFCFQQEATNTPSPSPAARVDKHTRCSVQLFEQNVVESPACNCADERAGGVDPKAWVERGLPPSCEHCNHSWAKITCLRVRTAIKVGDVIIGIAHVSIKWDPLKCIIEWGTMLAERITCVAMAVKTVVWIAASTLRVSCNTNKESSFSYRVHSAACVVIVSHRNARTSA